MGCFCACALGRHVLRWRRHMTPRATRPRVTPPPANYQLAPPSLVCPTKPTNTARRATARLKHFFMKVLSQSAHFFCTSLALAYLCLPYSEVIVLARTDHGNSAVLFSQRYKPHLENCQRMMCLLNSALFRYSATSPHRATKPSWGWLHIGGSKQRLVLAESDPTSNWQSPVLVLL